MGQLIDGQAHAGGDKGEKGDERGGQLAAVVFVRRYTATTLPRYEFVHASSPAGAG